MVSKKIYITIFIIVLLFFGIVYFASSGYVDNQIYVAMDPDKLLGYNGDKWFKVDLNNKMRENFDVYDGTGEYYGKNFISYNNKRNSFAVYDKNYNNINKKGEIFAYRANVPTTYFPLIQEEINIYEKKILDKFLKDNKIDFDSTNAFSFKYVIDLNNNGKDDTIIVSNLYPAASCCGDGYSAALAIMDNNKILKIQLKSTLDSPTKTHYAISLKGALDIKNDGKKELFFSNSVFGNSIVCSSIYKYKNNKFIAEMQC